MEKEMFKSWLNEKCETQVYVDVVKENKDYLDWAFDLIENEQGSVKYMAEKVIRSISEQDPQFLSEYLNRIIENFYHKNQFIHWGFTYTLVNMLPLIEKEKWETLKQDVLNSLTSFNMIEYGNLVKVADQICQADSSILKPLMESFLMIKEHVFYHHDEVSKACNNIVIGQILDFFMKVHPIEYRTEILDFAKENTDNERNSTAKKARALLKRLS